MLKWLQSSLHHCHLYLAKSMDWQYPMTSEKLPSYIIMDSSNGPSSKHSIAYENEDPDRLYTYINCLLVMLGNISSNFVESEIFIIQLYNQTWCSMLVGESPREFTWSQSLSMIMGEVLVTFNSDITEGAGSSPDTPTSLLSSDRQVWKSFLKK